MQGTYTFWLVYLSIAVAIVVSYTALQLAARVSRADGLAGVVWLAGGAVAMGFGIWSMHFIGMLALRLPIQLTYELTTTVLSLTIAIVTSGFALAIVSRPTVGMLRLSMGAVMMGAGISAMHYLGMYSIRIVPGITYDLVLFATSIVVAIAASFAALWLAFKLRNGHSWKMVLTRMGAAVVMGFAVCGMHYTGMAASQFGANSYCLPGAPLDNIWFAVTLGVLAFGIMTVTLLTIVFDTHLARRTRHHDEQTDARVRYAASHDVLTGLPNRTAIMQAVEESVLESKNRNAELALMVLDVDRLKAVNDSLGHQEGDKLLQENLNGDAQIDGKILFLCISVRISLEELKI